MKSALTLLFGAGLLLAAILRPSGVITILTSILRVPRDIVNTTAGITRRELRGK